MKLLYHPTSPFARKVQICAMVRGLADKIELEEAVPNDLPPLLLASNPLGKVPCLLTDEGEAIFDSPVICEYLDGIGDAPAMFPAERKARFAALKLQALADGLMDATVLRRGESLRPKEEAREAAMAKFKTVIGRSLDALEGMELPQEFNIGTISVACALGYLTLRFSDEPWREGHPNLTKWFAAFGLQPAIIGTKPKAA
jgi:glutathione S-transferase